MIKNIPCTFCEQIECQCETRIKIARDIFNDRRLNIIARITQMEKDIYEESNRKRNAGVPFKDRLVDTSNQNRLDNLRLLVRGMQFSEMEIAPYLHFGTTLEEFAEWAQKEIYYFPELYSI